jgi:glycosyltransferase involved in cell wall biosynthesis
MKNDKLTINNLTVAIPTYNREQYLSKILKSIPTGIKTIVSDNGSYLPKEFIAGFDNVNFMQQTPVVDVIINWNKCIKAVDTEWFMLPSDDDLYYDDSFEIIEHYLSKYNDADLLIFGHNVIDKDANEISNWVPGSEVEYVGPYGYDIFKYGVESRFPGMVFKTSKVNQLGNLDESYKLTAADSKMIQQVMLSGKVVFINKVIGAYRTWPQNSTALTSGTIGWLKEIDKWQNEMESFIKTNIKGFNLKRFVNIKDEVYARNLLESITKIKSVSGFKATCTFMRNIRFPWKANFSTRLRIIKTLLLK